MNKKLLDAMICLLLLALLLAAPGILPAQQK